MKVNGNIITVTIPRVDPDVAVALTWGAALTSSAAIGSTVHDTAIINAAYVPQVTATPAAVFVGAMNTVYDAIGGSAHPISGASVALVDAGGQPAKLSASDHGGNPFTTSQNGTFAFALPAASAHENDYQLDVSAAGYLNRRIKLALVTSGGTTTSTLSALDGLPLATAGGFGLTSGSVSVSDIPSFYGNVPMFAPQALIVTATTDRSVVSAGDRLGYSVTFGPGSKPLSDPGDLNLTLPAGFAYARGTARLDGAAVEPAVNGSNLAWSVKELTQNNTLTFDAVALPSVSTGATLTTQVQAKAVLPGASLTANASVSVSIVGGPLSSRSILTGRVFTDHGHDGHFVAGDTGVAGVRIYLEDGESVMTDRDGKFSFPAARPGMHVLHLDPITLPAGLRPYHGFPVNDPRSVMRLVHGIFDSGLMSDVNFAVDDARAH
jgi:hypothetical protein